MKEQWQEKLMSYAKWTYKLLDFKEEWELFTNYFKRQQKDLESLAGFK